MKKALFITTISIKKINSGGKVYTKSIIDLCKNNGYEVDLIHFSSINNPEESTNYVFHRLNIFDFLNLRPVPHLNYYYRKKMLRLINYLLDKNNYELLVFDHLQMGQYINMINKKYIEKSILILHNVESELVKTTFKNRLIKPIMKLYSKIYLKLEMNIINSFDRIYAISSDDIRFYNSNGIRKKIKQLITLRNVEKSKTNLNFVNQNDLNLLFIGNYNWYPNVEAALFLINFLKIFPVISNKNVVLNLVGINLPNFLINLCKQNQNCNYLGFVENLEDVYKNNDLFINAIFSGSGVNIKLIESIEYGIPVISTEFGMRGLDFLKDISKFFFSDSDLVTVINDLLSTKSRVKYVNLQYEMLRKHSLINI